MKGKLFTIFLFPSKADLTVASDSKIHWAEVARVAIPPRTRIFLFPSPRAPPHWNGWQGIAIFLYERGRGTTNCKNFRQGFAGVFSLSLGSEFEPRRMEKDTKRNHSRSWKWRLQVSRSGHTGTAVRGRVGNRKQIVTPKGPVTCMGVFWGVLLCRAKIENKPLAIIRHLKQQFFRLIGAP